MSIPAGWSLSIHYVWHLHEPPPNVIFGCNFPEPHPGSLPPGKPLAMSDNGLILVHIAGSWYTRLYSMETWHAPTLGQDAAYKLFGASMFENKAVNNIKHTRRSHWRREECAANMAASIPVKDTPVTLTMPVKDAPATTIMWT